MSSITARRGTRSAASGRFVVRLDPELHARLRKAAEKAGLSLNELCARRLALPLSDAGGAGTALCTQAASLLGDALLGVIAYGSWARDELASNSDVDVLIVVDEDTEISRDLYRHWEESPLSWDDRNVDIHFAHLPTSSDQAGGLWLDVAVDGVTLFDRDLRLSRTLAAIRYAVASGKIIRHHAHGQSYWVEAH
jgi:predicted nucleotidyltransferase